MRLIVFLFALLFSAQAFAQDTGKVFNAESFMLDNGMQVVVIPNHRVPVVTHMVWYKVGAMDEAQGKSGIAHFLEHLMFKGSEGLGPGEFSEKIRRLGGNDNAFTSQDYTAYYQSIAAEHLETVMTMEAGRMRGMTLPPEEVDSERLVILEERRQRTDNDPRAQFGEKMSSALFPDHPYGVPIIGWPDEMANLSREDAKNFYDRWYGPNNAVLVVSGDVTGTQVFELAKKIYGPLPKIALPERVMTKKPPASAATAHVVMENKDIREPLVQIAMRVPTYLENREASLAMQVLEDILSGGPTSRLYKSLVIEQKIATSAGFSYDSSARGESTAWLYAAPMPGTSLETLQKALQDELRKVVKDGVTETELKESITRMQDEAAYARDSLTGPAMVFGASLVIGETMDDIEYWPRNIGTVTAAQVKDAATKFLNPDAPGAHKSVTGFLLPAKAAPVEEGLAPTEAVPTEKTK
jgi:zinc protease